MMQSAKVIIRRNILFFSGLVFAISVCLLLVAVSQEKHFIVASNKAEVEPWLEVLEEILKGLLAASAVAFLYDWILKLESTEQIRLIIGSEIEKIKFSTLGIDTDLRLNHSMEFIFSPLNGDSPGNEQNRFCRMSVHSRFDSRAPRDEVKFKLLISGEHVKPPEENTPYLFYWELVQAPSRAASGQWFEVKSLKIDSEDWSAGEPHIDNGMITVKFRRPKKAKVSRKQFVTYDFNIRTIANYTTPATFSYLVDQKIINAIFRVDARPLKSSSVRLNLSNTSKNAFPCKYIDAPEGDGTCQLYVNDTLEQGIAVMFTITGEALHSDNDR